MLSTRGTYLSWAPTRPSRTHRRRQLLEARFDLHYMLNAEAENEVQRAVPHRDFYNCRKVDTHVHHSACMNQKKLLRFIKKKLRTCPQEQVCKRDGKLLTLLEVFASLEMTPYDLSIDTLDMHADNTFHRFDRFNLKYNPAGQVCSDGQRRPPSRSCVRLDRTVTERILTHDPSSPRSTAARRRCTAYY